MVRKLLFFDIDGTLVNFQMHMPESAKTALRQAQKNGHKLFISSGRGKAQIYPFLLDFGFDGIVAGGGSYIEYGDKVIFQESFGEERLRTILDLFGEYHIAFMLQIPKGCVMTHVGMKRLVESLELAPQGAGTEEMKAAVEEFLGKVYLDDDMESFPEKYPDAQNLLYADSPFTIEQLQKKAGTGVKIMAPSVSHPKPGQGEVTLSGVSKALAIRRTAEYAGASIRDTVAFGDGANDVDMLRAAGTGVAMGNAIPEAKAAADFITKDIDDDGIRFAMETLGLI